MNATQIALEAGATLEEWHKSHNSACQLYIENGHVKSKAPDYMFCKGYPDLVFSPWHLVHGLTSQQWNIVGTALLNLYNKEKACQAHRKP